MYQNESIQYYPKVIEKKVIICRLISLQFCHLRKSGTIMSRFVKKCVCRWLSL